MPKKIKLALCCCFLVHCFLSSCWAAASDGDGIRVGFPEWPPFVDFEKGIPNGPLVTLLDEAVKNLGSEWEAVAIERDKGISMLLDGDIDILVDLMENTDIGERFSVTDPRLIPEWAEVFCSQSLLPYGVSGLRKQKVVLLEGDIAAGRYIEGLSRMGWGTEAVFAKTPDSLVALFREGKVQAIVCSKFIGHMLRENTDLGAPFLSGPLQGIVFLSLKQHDRLLGELQGRLEDILGGNSTDTSLNLFFQEYAKALPNLTLPNWVRWVPILFVVLFVASVVLFNQLNVKSDELYYKNEELKQEIQEKTMAESELREERDFSRALIETVGVIVLVVDGYGVITGANRTLSQVLGFTPDDVKGKYIWDLVNAAEHIFGGPASWLLNERIKKRIRISLPPRFESVSVAKDGSAQVIEWHNATLRGTDGAFRNIICTGMKITERKLAEEKLKESEKSYRQLFENLQQIFFRTDKEGNLTLISPSITGFLGYSREEITGTLFPWNFCRRGEDIRYLQDFVRGGNDSLVEEREILFSRKDGEDAWGLLNIRKIFDPEGTLLGTEGMITDYSLQKRVQAALTEKAELEKGLKQAHAQIVLSQLNPHFLFNTLNLIARMAGGEGALQTEDITIYFAKYLRYVLRKQTREDMIPLEQELNGIENLLAIYKRRFDQRFEYSISSDGTSQDVTVPFMILQPLVENALVHSVEGCSRTVHLDILATRYNGEIHLVIRDDGVGFDMKRFQEGKGIFSVRERLRLYYGDQASMKIRSRLHEGTEIVVVIPAKKPKNQGLKED